MIGRGLLAGAFMAIMAGSMIGAEPPRMIGKPMRQKPKHKPTKATKRNAKRRRRGQHMWHI